MDVATLWAFASTVSPVTVLVDDAIWPWKGLRWAHLVSDGSLEELHEMARLIGKRRLGFQGDHYDVDEVDRLRAIDFGALAIDSRQLVRRLRSAGLRRAESKPAWRQVARWPQGVEMGSWREALGSHGSPGRRLSAGLDAFESRLSDLGLALFVDETRLVALVEIGADSELPWPPDQAEGTLSMIDEIVVGEPRVDGDRSIELFVAK